jgi:dTDP-glucose 4,6-dehydratase
LLGSHMCDRMIQEAGAVLCVDSLLAEREDNIAHLLDDGRLRFQTHDVTEPLTVEDRVDAVIHMASPASPADYLRWPIETLEVVAFGTLRALELVLGKDTTLFLASTSKTYGDPTVHPQPETYLVNGNPLGRSVYDEFKRFTEAATMAHHRPPASVTDREDLQHVWPADAARRRPRCPCPDVHPTDARRRAADRSQRGQQTRSLCYVDDVVEGRYRLIVSDVTGPVTSGTSTGSRSGSWRSWCGTQRQ